MCDQIIFWCIPFGVEYNSCILVVAYAPTPSVSRLVMGGAAVMTEHRRLSLTQ